MQSRRSATRQPVVKMLLKCFNCVIHKKCKEADFEWCDLEMACDTADRDNGGLLRPQQESVCSMQIGRKGNSVSFTWDHFIIIVLLKQRNTYRQRKWVSPATNYTTNYRQTVVIPLPWWLTMVVVCLSDCGVIIEIWLWKRSHFCWLWFALIWQFN